MLNWLLSLQVLRPKGLTEDEAEYLAKQLTFKTHPHTFKDAHTIVKQLLDEYDEQNV